MNLKDRLEANLRELDKDSVNEMLIIGDITFLLREDTVIDTEIIFALKELDDPLIQALCSYLKWKLSPHENFNEIKIFFTNLLSAMNKYSKYHNLNTKLLETYINKKIQFNRYSELEDNLLDLKVYLDKIFDYELVYLQERIIRSFVTALISLAKNWKINKTFSIGLEIYNICLEFEKKYINSNRYDLERIFIKFRIDVNKILNKYDEKSMKHRIAESYEDEGDFNEKKGLGLGLISYSNAFMNYLDLGEKNRLEKVKRKIKNSGKATKSSLRSLAIGTFKININESIQKIIKKINYDNVLKSLTNLSLLYPKIHLPSDEEIGVGIKIMPVVVLDDYDNVSAILEWEEDKEECRKFRAFQILKIEEAKLSLVRTEVFKFLIQNELFSKKEIYKLLDSSPIEENLKERLKFGICKHFDGNYISSSYVLTLQIEQLLITLVRIKTNLIAMSHKKGRRGATQETTLGTLLNNDEVRILFNEDFYNLLQLYFTYDLGLNYRNEIAHGLISHEKLSEQYSLTIILFICRILFMLLE